MCDLKLEKNDIIVFNATQSFGLGLAGNYTVLRVYLIECLPMKKREICMAVVDIAWILGYLFALGVSWSLVPSIIRMLYQKFRPNSWRVLSGIGGAPSLIIGCAISLLPETPRFLLYQQRQEEALQVLRQIYAINNSKHIETYPVFFDQALI
ncbi:PREDICTED: synaptic vesicle glycoprotein 2B-like [Polistes dominula]|uniref:Synaptic vesicle glycoprotein 2B-like n=1 Tax=Polistes dominula TaxID=743375 RepID=A0ABM1J741_POLDO|nr:PREDICTED: synaptic vesicle glycoprotein 2B-like [Polistes dominula]